MRLDVFEPTFLIQIEGQQLSLDITQEITSFVFEDNEEELDVMELTVANRGGSSWTILFMDRELCGELQC